jgi:predicted RNA-binding Zn-ribbon protein involved in translation (DUF1610 family)
MQGLEMSSMRTHHKCPACGEPTISTLRKFVAGALLPIQCRKCGSIVDVSGVTWTVASLFADVFLFLAAIFALASAIKDPTYGAVLLMASVFGWLIFGFGATRLGQLTVVMDNRNRDANRMPPPGAVPRSMFGCLLWHGWFSGIVRVAWAGSIVGLPVAVYLQDIVLSALCLAMILFTGLAMRRLSSIVEQVHACPACGEYTISSWEKLYPPLLVRPACPNCATKYIISGNILAYDSMAAFILLAGVLVTCLYFGNAFPVLLFGVCIFASAVFAINYVPMIVVSKKTKADTSASPPP